MKKIFTIAIAFIAVLSMVSCNDDEGSSLVFQARPEVLTFGVAGGEPKIIDVITSADVSWKAEVESAAQDWLTITTEADKVIVRAAENETLEQRSGKITIKPDDGNLQRIDVVVLQYAVPVTSIEATKAMLLFSGNLYGCGLGSYYMVMGNGDTEFIDGRYLDWNMNDGYWIFFDILTEEISPEMYKKIELKEGVYKNSMDPNITDLYGENFEFQKMSFIATLIIESEAGIALNFSYILKYENGKIVEWFAISEGEITVRNDNGDYTIAADLTTPEGEKVLINYSGKFDEEVNLASLSTYTSDLDLSELNTGTLEFWAEPESWGEIQEGCYQWIVRIDTPGYADVSELMLALFSSTTSTTAPDNGIYVFDFSVYEPFIAEMGWMEPFGDDIYGSWVLGYTGGELTDYSPLFKGTVELTHNGGDNYTIEVDALLDNYYTFTASFEGDLEYVDMTATPQPMPPLKIPSAKMYRNAAFMDGVVIDKSNLYK